MFRTLFFLILTFSFSACLKKPRHPQPETIDPIYQDISNKKAKTEALLKMAEKTFREVTARDLKEVEPQTGKAAGIRSRYFKELRMIKKLRQEILYYDFRLSSRKIEARKAYSYAYERNLPWPDPKDIEKYKINEKLRAASNSWDDRVPKIDHRVEQYKAELKRKIAAQSTQETASEQP